MSEEEPLLTFPCEFPVKAMGKASPAFRDEVMTVFERHVPDLAEADVTTQDSSGGRFVSITVVVNATSREQLDELYQALNDLESVLMTL